ncbi:hypothetical protein [Xenorhabdus bovienii]|uniref:hypothetical protein n=1 Tax=Xenorhabdus bovienii TaxID=40576 RepID=UPI0023B30832|nr:hypothetical protein [Xenorhabdus bovienii]MDE9429835.1 hypothetical protein [Xenorhabdus bovienii]
MSIMKKNQPSRVRNKLSLCRQRATVIVCELNAGLGFHFCNHYLLSGNNNDLWWPLSEKEKLFTEIEKVMVMNHVAHNVTFINKLRHINKAIDYEVVYNMIEK